MTDRAQPNGEPICSGEGAARRCVRLIVDAGGRQRWELVSATSHQTFMMMQRVAMFTVALLVAVASARLWMRWQGRSRYSSAF